MLNESKWPNFGPGVVREKNKNTEEKEILAVDPKAAKQELEKTFPASTIGKINKDSSLVDIRTARKQAIRDVDWQRSQQLLEAANNPKTAFEVYRNLASRDQFGFDWGSCHIEGEGRYEFLEKLTEQVAQDPAGFAMLKRDIQKPKLGVIFHFQSDGFDKNFDFMKSIITKALFKANPSEAGNFAISFLTKLQKKNESSIKKREKWQREMKLEEEMAEYSSRDIRKNKQEIPYGELVSGSEITTAVLYDDFERTVKAIIDNLGKYAAENNLSKKTVDALTDYLTKDHRAFGHSQELTKCFEKTDINYSAQKLLAVLRDAETDPWARKLATNILYRLEFGRLGISPEGVKYLERMYDLGELNNPDYFAQRLTRNGEVGIFNENKELIKYFKLSDLSSSEGKVKAHVLSFAYETLFIPQVGESDTERTQREKALEEFKQNYFSFFDDRFFQDTGVAFNNFSFLEQGKFLQFVEQADEIKKQKTYDFVKKYGEDGFRAFLSLEYGQEYGEVLMSLDNSKFITEDEVKMILKEYNILNDRAMEIAKTMKKSELFEEVGLSEEGLADAFAEQFSEAILRRAKDALNTAQAIAQSGRAEARFYSRLDIECDSPKEVIEALQIYSNTLEKIECLMKPADKTNRFEIKLSESDLRQIPEIYSFTVLDKATKQLSYLTIQLREEGAHQYNQEMEFNGEARINILTHHEPIGKTLSEPSRQQALSARFDLEGIVRLNGEIIANDPAKGREMSWEVGLAENKKSSLPGDVIGRVIGIGNALGEKRKQKDTKEYPQYYHNRESFVEELGKPEVFAKIVRFIRRQIETNYHQAA